MVLLALMPAIAQCMLPEGGFSARSTLPTDPTLYFFQTVDLKHSPRFTAETTTGSTLKATATRLPSPEGFVAWKVEVDTLDGTDIQVQAEIPNLAPYQHTASISPRAPYDPSAPGITDAGETLDSWPCSYTRTHDLNLNAPGAAAFLLDWTVRGIPQQAVLPDHPGRLYAQDPKGEKRLELGHLNCLGQSFEWPDEPVEITISSLFPDGAESKPSKMVLPPPAPAPTLE